MYLKAYEAKNDRIQGNKILVDAFAMEQAKE